MIVWGFAEDTLEAASLRCLKAGLEGGVLPSRVPRFLEGHGMNVVVAQMGEQWPVGIETGDVDAGDMQTVRGLRGSVTVAVGGVSSKGGVRGPKEVASSGMKTGPVRGGV